MVQLLDQDIQTKEVLDWKGVHLFHYAYSSCSQKTRIFLNLKGIAWESHHISLAAKEQWSPWYLGINPRGLVPALVFDGAVHIESNDIIQLLDREFPDNKLVPTGFEDQVGALLKHEDDLHLDIRTLNFRFSQPKDVTARTEEDVRMLREGGSGTVRGKVDPEKDHQIEFWQTVLEKGLTDEAVKASVGRLRAAFDDIEQRLAQTPYILGETLTVLDIAWFIYAMKVLRCNYPLERLHPHVNTWYQKLLQRPEFSSEIQFDAVLQKKVDDHLQYQIDTGTTISDIAGLKPLESIQSDD